MTRPLDSVTYAVIDTETTGLYPSTDRIIEVAVERIDTDGRVLGRYETLVNPHRDVGPTSIHGVTAGMAREAPTFVHVAGEILEWARDAVWVGHNISFDLRFLKAEFDRIDYDLATFPILCTLRLSRPFGPTVVSHKLGCLCEACNIRHDDAHSAASDARATGELLVQFLKRARKQGKTKLEDLDEFSPTSLCDPLRRFRQSPQRAGQLSKEQNPQK